MEAEPPPLEERRRLQEELSEFVESCCRTLEEVTASLGWSLDQLDPGDEAEAEVRGEVARAVEPRSLRPGAMQGRTGLVRCMSRGCCCWAWRLASSCHKDSALR